MCHLSRQSRRVTYQLLRKSKVGYISLLQLKGALHWRQIAGSSETSASSYRTIRRHIPQDGNLRSYINRISSLL